MATPPRPRIPVPTVKDPVGVLTLAGAILQKHLADGAKSLIQGQVKTALEAVATDIAAAEADNEEAKTLAKKLEEVYERRNNHIARIQPVLPRVSKGLQSEFGPDGLRQMGAYGFTVDDSLRAKPAPKPPKAGGVSGG